LLRRHLQTDRQTDAQSNENSICANSLCSLGGDKYNFKHYVLTDYYKPQTIEGKELIINNIGTRTILKINNHQKFRYS